MDNLTHTLVGAALAEAGLKRRTAMGAATLMIGANFPDVDVIAVPLGAGIEFRRGVTHGFLALAILPFVFAGIMWLWGRARHRHDATSPPADYRQLVILSAISIATHPVLDYMNTYGMRWLMPFVNEWFYADGLFIVDVWLFGALLLGVIWSARDRNTRPARVALVAIAAYTTAMLVVTGIGRMQFRAKHGPAPVMVAPTPLVPWERLVVVDEGHSYRYGSYSLFGGVRLTAATMAKGDDDPAVALARRASKAQGFLDWARLPFYRVSREGDQTVVRIGDARYAGDDATGWASVEVRIPASSTIGP